MEGTASQQCAAQYLHGRGHVGPMKKWMLPILLLNKGHEHSTCRSFCSPTGMIMRPPGFNCSTSTCSPDT